MKALHDPAHLLEAGLSAIRAQYQVPVGFPAEVLAAAEVAASRVPSEHVDRTALRFVTLDPAQSTDLDQAFAIEADGGDLVLRYAIADVAWFVDDGEAIDAEAWRRGSTLYLPDGKAGLYPPVLSEGAASLLPDGPRPAVLFHIRIAPDGATRLDGAERAIIHSRAKLAYDRVSDDDLPREFAELARRIAVAEERRGASRVEPPEQEVIPVEGGGFELRFRPRLQSEAHNAALSLAANLAIADCLLEHRTGLFRVMPAPFDSAVKRLRLTAKAFAIAWPAAKALREFERGLDPAKRRDAAMMMAIRRAGRGAAYVPFDPDVAPWHSAMAASYAHATAPLRRLADRYVVMATLALANGRPVPNAVEQAFARLPKVMARADSVDSQIGRAVIDLAETVLLSARIGERFAAVVTDVDERGARIQLCELAVVARLAADGLQPGDSIDVTLLAADPIARALDFAVAR